MTTIDKTSSVRNITRRVLVQSGLGALAAPLVLRTHLAHAQGRVIKIGFVSPITGATAGFGEPDPYHEERINQLTESLMARDAEPRETPVGTTRDSP